MTKEGPESKSFWQELRRRKVVRVTLAYVIVGWVLIQVADVTLQPLHLPTWAGTMVIWLVALGFPVAVILAWVLDVTPQGITVTQAVNEPVPDDATIAVLPFVNMSGDEENEYFSDGMSEELLNLLSRLQHLRVCSRTSAFSLKGTTLGMPAIAAQLGVRYVLEGSVRRSGDKVRSTAQLIDAPEDCHLWSETYDRELQDIFAVQDEIAGHIFSSLRMTLTPTEQQAIQSTTDNVDAFDYYLRGRQKYHRTEPGHLEMARKLFEEAIRIDPNYGLAWAGLTYVFVDTYWYRDKQAIWIEQAQDASIKAVESAPHLAESHGARGLALRVQESFADAEIEFKKAMEINPQLFEPIHFYAQMLRSMERFDESARMFVKAAAARPEDYQAIALASNMFDAIGDAESELQANKEVLVRTTRALQLNPADSRALVLGAMGHLRAGDAKTAVEWVEKAYKFDPESASTAYNSACLYAKIGKFDRALDLIEVAIRLGNRNKRYFETDPDFEPLSEHPRFKEILSRI
jgi:adenylate cyclase